MASKTPKKGKKDFDKEKMYAKIMPTILPDPAEEEEDELPQYGQETQGDKSPPAGAPKYILRNYVEDIVLERFSHTMQTLQCCQCEKCKKDVMAHALNALSPVYLAAEPDQVDQVVQELRSGIEVKVSTALIKAVQYVKANPAHE